MLLSQAKFYAVDIFHWYVTTTFAKLLIFSWYYLYYCSSSPRMIISSAKISGVALLHIDDTGTSLPVWWLFHYFATESGRSIDIFIAGAALSYLLSNICHFHNEAYNEISLYQFTTTGHSWLMALASLGFIKMNIMKCIIVAFSALFSWGTASPLLFLRHDILNFPRCFRQKAITACHWAHFLIRYWYISFQQFHLILAHQSYPRHINILFYALICHGFALYFALCGASPLSILQSIFHFERCIENASHTVAGSFIMMMRLSLLEWKIKFLGN